MITKPCLSTLEFLERAINVGNLLDLKPNGPSKIMENKPFNLLGRERLHHLIAGLIFCSRKLLKWDAKKKRMFKKELKDKIAMLKDLQLQSSPNMVVIKSLDGEIDN